MQGCELSQGSIVSMNGRGADIRDAERTAAWLYLDELIHRTLNDYAILLSIVRRAASSSSDSASGKALDEVTRRLRASVAAFRALSPPHDTGSRNLDQELGAICAAISASMLSERRVRVSLVSAPICVSAYHCWKICLVVAELLRNAIRHAFYGQQEGAIKVELCSCAETIRCGVVDDGCAQVDFVPGRGSAIIAAIAAELGGTIFRRHGKIGSTVLLEIPASITRPRTDNTIK